MSTEQSLSERIVVPPPSPTEEQRAGGAANVPVPGVAGVDDAQHGTALAAAHTPTVPPAPAPAGTGQAVDEAGSEPGRPRMAFNPTVAPEQARAIPSQSTLSAEPPSATAAIGTEIPQPAGSKREEPDQHTALSAETVPAHDKVEIPSKKTDLGAELEAEIEAALSGAGSLALGDAAANLATDAAAVKAGAPSDQEPQPGAKVKGRVVSVHGDSIIVDLGTRNSGVVQTRQYEGAPLPEVGTVLDLVVEKIDPAEGLIHLHLPKAVVSKPAGNWHEVAEGQIVDCMVVKSNKGGLEVSISNLRGFLPAGQVDFGFVSNLDEFVGQKLRVKIIEVNQHKRNLVVSRRAFLEIARAEAREEIWKTLEVGKRYTGTVKTLKDYGAFVDIGGVDGLLHVGELSWGRVTHPKDVLAEGQQVEVQILSIDTEKSKISLGMRQLQQNPWQGVAERFPPSTVVHGKVTKTTEFGAFVELEPGIEGLVHISELDHRRVHRVTDVLQVGKEVDVQVLSIDLDKKRIALSLKALIAKPQQKEAKSDEDLAPSAGTQYERKRKGPLKGGGTGSGGMLFGS